VLTAAGVRDLLRRHELAPNRRLGQNFVTDHNTLRKMVRDAGVKPGDHVCEIGPGLGSLTLALREAGARVTAIEVDAGLVRALQEVVGHDPQVRLIHADVRDLDLPTLIPRPALVVANLPYSVATAVTLDLLALEHFEHLHLMVQREVGLRWCARVGDPLYGAVSLKVEAYADARVVAAVSRQAFYPVPRVDSVTVGLTPHLWSWPAASSSEAVGHVAVERPAVLALIDQGFRARRKRLGNALAPRVPVAATDAALAAIGRSRDARAEELDLRTWCKFAVALRERHIAGWESTALA
jgi:16S rRNA (adenine1518-N6/adenine1519-N6)-dimethyltransferase